MPTENDISQNHNQPQDLRPGYRIPYFKGHDTPLSAQHINKLVGAGNAFLNLKIKRRPAIPDADGNVTSTARFSLSDDGAIIELLDAEGTTSATIFNTDQTFIASCPSGSTGSTVTATVVAGTIGVDPPKTVADANALALELATDRATLALVCTPTGTQGVNGSVASCTQMAGGQILVTGQFTRAEGLFRPGVCLFFTNLYLHPACWISIEYNGFGGDWQSPLYATTCDMGDGSFMLFEQLLFGGNTLRILQAYGIGGFEPTNAGPGPGYVDIASPHRLLVDGTYDYSFNTPAGSPPYGTGFAGGGVPGAIKDGNGKYIVASPTGNPPYNGNNTGPLTRIETDGNYLSTLPLTDHTGAALANTFAALVTLMITTSNHHIHVLFFSLVVGGSRCKYSGTSVGSNYFLHLDSNRNMVAWTDAGTGFSSAPQGFCVLTDGSGNITGYVFVAAGMTYNGSTQTHVIKTDASGNFDSSLNANAAFTQSGGSPSLSSIIKQGAKFIVCGIFDGVAGHAYTGMVRLNADGSVDTSFTGFTSISGGSYGVGATLLSNGTIVIFGSFSSLTQSGAHTRNNIALLDANGNLLGSG